MSLQGLLVTEEKGEEEKEKEEKKKGHPLWMYEAWLPGQKQGIK